jgi:cytochrome c peroxidase
MRPLPLLLLMLLGTAALPLGAGLPAVPVPPANPVTEPKRMLGKILFWDEQLSSDDTVACGTCHRPSSGGADPRAATHPGALPGTIDNVAGSPGIRLLGPDGNPRDHPLFGDEPQITNRLAPSIFGALWAGEQFWDGRAGGTLFDPLTGEVVLPGGASLENQALMTILNTAEMSREGRSWSDVSAKLARVAPLALADQWPADVAAAIAASPTYASLFRAAFGDASITPVRIAMAIASYERTLVPDQTPWDRFIEGDESALNRFERVGWQSFQSLKCVNCHEPPLFTTNGYANIGLRRSEFDRGRASVTDETDDAGDMKIPSLRNAGLRKRFMHTGEFASLGAAVDFYRQPGTLPDVDRIPGAGVYSFSLSQQTVADLSAFLGTALTDPRVANGTHPFDRPRLASER